VDVREIWSSIMVMNINTYCFFFFLAGILCNLVSAAELDLSSASTRISDKSSITLENLTIDDQAYNATIELKLDGTYTVISSQVIDTSETATYEVSFESTWSSSSHPTDFPLSSAHFSGLVGASHKATLNFWKIGELASEGIESMAETGSKSALIKEINAAIMQGTVDQSLSGDGIASSPGRVKLSFQVSRSFPYITLVSMIAPSPDWFVGVEGLNLLANGSWQDEIIIPLYAYDSGTDSGSSYASPNSDTQPASNSRQRSGPSRF